jgi:hypothetical protein
VFGFKVTASGAFDYDAGLDGFLSGRGSPDLVVPGFSVTIDATALTMPQFWLMDSATALTVMRATSVVQDVTLIPGNYRLGTPLGPGCASS